MKVGAGLICLVGMMGAGKTTVGRELARRHGLRFVDCDHEIEARCGVRVATIFELEGEDGFRARETQTLEELTQERGLVLATGGGAVLRAENRELLASRCLVVYLNVPPAILWERTRHDRSRPLLRVPDPKKRIEELYLARDPYYRQVADLIVEGGRCNPGAMVRVVERALADEGVNVEGMGLGCEASPAGSADSQSNG